MYKLKLTTKGVRSVGKTKEHVSVTHDKKEFYSWPEVTAAVTQFLNSSSSKALQQALTITVTPGKAKAEKLEQVEQVEQVENNEPAEVTNEVKELTAPTEPIKPVPRPTPSAVPGNFQDFLKRISAEQQKD